MFLGLHSRWIHFVSIWSCSSEGLSSVTFWVSFSATRIPTPPPLLFVLGLRIHLYPFIDICSPLLSCVSVISAMDIFSVLRAASRLLFLPLIPLTLMVAMVISLFFLIRGLRFFLGVVALLFWSFFVVGGVVVPGVHLVYFENHGCLIFILVWGFLLGVGGVWVGGCFRTFGLSFFRGRWSRLSFGGGGVGRLPCGRVGRLPFGRLPCGRVGRLLYFGRVGRLPCGRVGRLSWFDRVDGLLYGRIGRLPYGRVGRLPYGRNDRLQSVGWNSTDLCDFDIRYSAGLTISQCRFFCLHHLLA